MVCLALFVAGFPLPGGADEAGVAGPVGPAPRVLTIPIRGPIEPALLYIIRRGAREAEAQGVRAVIFVIDTPGGRLDAAEEIMRILGALKVPRYAYVERHAFSAGALIALATERIYMAPGSVIGDALPIMALPLAGAQEMPPDLKEKMVSATSAMARAAAEQSGHNPAVAEAMVRAELELTVGGVLVKPAGQLLTLTNEEAAKLYGEESKPLLSAGTFDSLETLLDHLGLADAAVEELAVTGAERVARWIQALGALFLIIGAAGIYIEVRTPGFGVFGIAGITALAVFFWGHHVAGLAGYEDLALIVVGLILLAVEMAIPGFGLPGLLGTVFLFSGLLLAMADRPVDGGWLPTADGMVRPLVNLGLAAGGSILLGALLSKILPRTSAYRGLVLGASTSRAAGYRTSDDFAPLIGCAGTAATDLRPSGAALIDGRRLDVMSSGEFIVRGSVVRVVRVEGGLVVVEPGGGEGEGFA